MGGVSSAEPTAVPPYDVPDRVAVQLLLGGVRVFADGAGDPVIQPGHLLTARPQRPDVDQEADRDRISQIIDPRTTSVQKLFTSPLDVRHAGQFGIHG